MELASGTLFLAYVNDGWKVLPPLQLAAEHALRLHRWSGTVAAPAGSQQIGLRGYDD
jgi:hypothetical protein